LSPHFSPIDAAMLEPLGVAIHAADLAHLRPGWTVSVHGCGPIGLLALQVARIAGASRLIAIEPIPGRRALALKLGADYALDAAGTQVQEVLRLTDGRGVDMAFEAAGENQAVEDAVEAARPGGRVVLIGIPADDRTQFRASAARRKGLTILLCRRMKHTYPRAKSLVESGRIDLAGMITHHLPFADAAHAFDLVERRAEGVIKAVIEIPGR
jgi:L-iditol 2-dehydrogenase